MNRRTKTLAILAAVAAAAGLGALFVGQTAQSAVPGQAGKVMRMAGENSRLDRLADTPLGRFAARQFDRLAGLRGQLNVTGEQREQLRRIVESHRSELIPVAKSISEKRRALREAMMNATPEAIREAAADLGTAIGDAAVAAAPIIKEAKETLTPEQIEYLKEFRSGTDTEVDDLFKEMAK
jgi:Spy/CpxP family protein refolding chaperone